MRWFLSGRIPEASRVLLVESGSRPILERALSKMRHVFPEARFELCTCYPGLPASTGEGEPIARVWRVTEAVSTGDKLRMIRDMARSRPPIAALMFSGEQILFNWKMLLLVALPSKMLLVNENGDFFWLDRAHLGVLRQFAGARWGMNGEGLLRGALRALVFPIVLLYLLVFTLVGYAVRWARLAWWRIAGTSESNEPPA